MKVVVTHVYSATNRGDRLLALLTRDLIVDALGVVPDVVAVDADGFDDAGDTVVTYGRRPRSAPSALGVAASTLLPRRAAELAMIESADLVVGVGGAYLRTDDLRHVGVVAGVHLPQLVAAARSKQPWVMLPQSIGPMPAPLWALVDRLLRSTAAVHVRDDTTFGRYGHWANAHRTPDLAVLGVARIAPRTFQRERTESVVVQVRPLSARAAWAADVKDWAATTSLTLLPALQSTGGRLNNDEALTRDTWGPDVPALEEVLSGPDRPGAAICGRLHGALACIHDGVPAVHVAYERKSYGAFADMGLEAYLVPPTAAGLRRAEALCSELVADASEYWLRLERRLPSLSSAAEQLKVELRRASGWA